MDKLMILAAENGNHWLLPHDINELWWASTAFFIVVGFLWWKGGPAIRNAWNGRIERIESELAEAADTRTGAEQELSDVEARIADGDAERERILVEARETAETLREQLVARAESDAADVLARGTADIEASKSQAFADLRHEVGELAVGAAEAVVAGNLDPTTQRELVESYITDVGAGT